jgi:hypothetical protein
MVHTRHLALGAVYVISVMISGCATPGKVYRPTLSAVEVAQLADAKVRQEQRNPVNFLRQTPQYDETTDEWDVIYFNQHRQVIQFSVHVRDKTKETSIAINEFF